MRKVLVIGAHPEADSLSEFLLEYYVEQSMNAGHEVKFVKIRELKFDENLTNENRENPEEIILDQQELLLWCDHLVIFTPLWWMGFPARMKAWIDRVLLNGFAFEYRRGLPVGLLKGRSLRIIYSQAQPQWYCWLFKGDSFFRMVKNGVFGFCGFSPVKRFIISNVRKLNLKKLNHIRKQLKAFAIKAH